MTIKDMKKALPIILLIIVCCYLGYRYLQNPSNPILEPGLPLETQSANHPQNTPAPDIQPKSDVKPNAEAQPLIKPELDVQNSPTADSDPQIKPELDVQNSPTAETEAPPKLRIKEVLSSLNNTQHFARHTAEHIFNGSVNSKQQATGYHYDPIPDSDGKIMGAKGAPNKYGVYEANVTVRGIKKFRKSSFFPDDMTPQQIVDDIETAWQHRKPTTNKDEAFYGYSPKGMCIQMFIDPNNDKITSAFPKYDNKRCAVY